MLVYFKFLVIGTAILTCGICVGYIAFLKKCLLTLVLPKLHCDFISPSPHLLQTTVIIINYCQSKIMT